MSLDGRQAAEGNVALMRVRRSKRNAKYGRYQFVCNHGSKKGPIMQFLVGRIAVAVFRRIGAIECSCKDRPCKA
jgi:hypothetical protein